MEFKIKEARVRAGISQKDLAAKLGISASTLSGYESGDHDPKSDLLSIIADECQVTVDFLLGRSVPATASDRRVDLILRCYRELNEEGQERLAEYADDLVCSGKYIKSGQALLGRKEA